MASFHGYATSGRVHWETMLSSNGFKRRGGGQRNTYWHVEEGPAGPGIYVKTTPKKLEVVRRERVRTLEDRVLSSDFYGALSKGGEDTQRQVLTRLRNLLGQPTRMDPGVQADTAYGDVIKFYRKYQRVDWDAFGDLAVTLAAYRGEHNVFTRAFRDAWDQHDEQLAQELLTDRELIVRVRRDITYGPVNAKDEAHLRDDFAWVPGRRHFWFDHYILRGSGPPGGLRTDSIVQGARRQETGWWRAIGISNNEYLTNAAYATAEAAIAAAQTPQTPQTEEQLTPVTWDEVVERFYAGVHGASVSVWRGHTEDGDTYYGWSIDELYGDGHASVEPDVTGPRYIRLINAVNAAEEGVE